MNNANLPRTKRWFRFSLRIVLVALTVGCVLLGWNVNKAHRQKTTVAWVEAMGGSVGYDYAIDGTNISLPDAEPGPKWLRDAIGVDYLATVDYVDLSHSEVTDLSPLADLSKLKTLLLSHTTVKDLSPLTNLAELERLDLSNTQVSNLTPVANLTKLKSLSVFQSAVRDFAPLANLRDLESMDLGGTAVRDVFPFTRLMKLELLVLDDTSVPEADLATLREALPTCVVLGDSDNVERQ